MGSTRAGKGLAGLPGGGRDPGTQRAHRRGGRHAPLRATFGKIVNNLIWASAYIVAAITIAAISFLHPMICVIAMTTSSLLAIGNSLLLKRRYARQQPREEPSTATPAKGDRS